MAVDCQALIDALKPAMRQAGEAIMAVHTAGSTARRKGDGSPVTEADVAAEHIVLAALHRLDTGICVVSEENAASHRLAAPDRFFLVDPLDGTREFLKRDGKGEFTVNIGLVEQGVPVMGLVHAPASKRLFAGAAGIGAVEERVDASGALSHHTLAVRTVPESGVVAVASVSHRDDITQNWLQDHDVGAVVSVGSSLKFCLLAAGEADVYPRFSPTMEWDTAAGDAILRAAGGCLTQPDGAPFLYGKPDYRNGAFIARGKCQ